MSFQSKATDQALACLVGELCIFNANELKQELLLLAQDSAVCTFDLSDVSEIDTAGVQLLLMVKREAAGDGRSIGYVNHSEPVLEAIRLLGLGLELDDPVATFSAGGVE